jgi:hypothetical protein
MLPLQVSGKAASLSRPRAATDSASAAAGQPAAPASSGAALHEVTDRPMTGLR